MDILSADQKIKAKQPVAAWLISILLIGVLFFVVHSYAHWQRLAHIFSKLTPADLVLVVIIGFLMPMFQGIALTRFFHLMGRARSSLYGILMFMAMNTVNTAAPVVGLSGSAFLVVHETQAGTDNPKAILLVILFYLTDYSVLLSMLLLGIGYLLLIGHVSFSILVSVSLLMLLLGLAVVMTIYFFSHPSALRQFLLRSRWLTGRFLDSTRIELLSKQANEAWNEVKKSRGSLLHAALWMLATHLAGLLLLSVCFHAFHIHLTPQRLIAGYLVGVLLYTVSVTPAGIGVAESGMTATFTGLGVSLEAAVLIVLLYRAVTVLLPLGYGAIALQALSALARKPRSTVYLG